MKKIFLIPFLCLAFIVSQGQTIELENRFLLNNKVQILLPKSFDTMPEDMVKVKYPGEQRPTLVFSDESTEVNFALNHTSSKASQAVLEKYREVFVETFKKSFPSAEWEDNGIKMINGKKVGFLKLVSQAIDTKIYNLLFFTDLDGKLIIFTFNCTIEKKAEWAETAEKIFNSLKIK